MPFFKALCVPLRRIISDLAADQFAELRASEQAEVVARLRLGFRPSVECVIFEDSKADISRVAIVWSAVVNGLNAGQLNSSLQALPARP